jgi:hypothetical protein
MFVPLRVAALIAFSVAARGPAIAAEILRVEPAPFGGAHGMAYVGSGLVLADTFQAAGSSSGLYAQDSAGRWLPAGITGTQLAGISAAGTGYLLCDVGASRVLELDSQLRTVRRWSVPHPWNAKRDSRGFTFALSADGAFYRLDPNGSARALITGLDAPFDFELTPDFTGVWISEQGASEGAVSQWKLTGDLLGARPAS